MKLERQPTQSVLKLYMTPLSLTFVLARETRYICLCLMPEHPHAQKKRPSINQRFQ